MPASASSHLSNSNEEWPDIIQAPVRLPDGRINAKQGYKIKMPTSKPTKVVSFNKKMSADDLSSIKQKDAFMYYSIPAVRSAKLLQKEVEESTNLDDSQLTRNWISCPSRLQTTQLGKKDGSLIVKRSSRISFECHPTLLDDLEEEDSGGDNDCSDDDFSDDPFDSMLKSLSTQCLR